MSDDDNATKRRLKRIRAALIDESAPKPELPAEPKVRQAQSIHDVTISGSHNIVGNVVNFNPKPARPRIVVQAGDGAISSGQAAKLQALVKEIVELEGKVKKSPATFSKVWGALNGKMGVAGYRELPAEHFEKARKYLQQWIGRLNSSASASVKDGDNWRKRFYAYIKINTKDPVDASAFDAYMRRNFRASSLTELSNDELDRAYRYVAGRRNRKG